MFIFHFKTLSCILVINILLNKTRFSSGKDFFMYGLPFFTIRNLQPNLTLESSPGENMCS